MGFRHIVFSGMTFLVAIALHPLSSAQSSSSAKHTRKPAPVADSALDAGSVKDGAYRNSALGFACKIPAGWVLRTEEMNAREEDATGNSQPQRTQSDTEENQTPGGRVLLAAFSRPPEARGEDVNSSILIAAESAALYPGLKEAAQYFGPVTEIAKAQGFTVNNEPYEFQVGAKTVVRADFEKTVGTRVLRQSTIAMLARGYAISFTFLAGTDDEIEELMAGLDLGGPKKP